MDLIFSFLAICLFSAGLPVFGMALVAISLVVFFIKQGVVKELTFDIRKENSKG